jgi:hypothetical protein
MHEFPIFKVELVRSVQLYSMAMPHSMVIIIEGPFVIALAKPIFGMKPRP